MIKRLLNKFPQFVSEDLKSDVPMLLSGYELITDTKEFLDKNYKGCYETDLVNYVTKRVYVSTKKYSLFLNLIFKAVYGKEVIILEVDSDDKNVIYKIKFNTSVLSDSDKSNLSEILSDTKTKIEFHDDHILVKFVFVTSCFSTFNAVSSRIVYNSLQNYFFA